MVAMELFSLLEGLKLPNKHHKDPKRPKDLSPPKLCRVLTLSMRSTVLLRQVIPLDSK